MAEAATENSSPNVNHSAGCSGQVQPGKPALSPQETDMATGKQAGTKTGAWVQG